MAQGSGASSSLSVRRSSQSGTLAMTLAWQVLYTQSCTQPYFFVGAVIDLTNMVALNVIDIRIEKTLVSGGAWVVHDQLQYVGVQPVTHPACNIGGLVDTYGVRISARQTVGALISLDCEFYDAKRLGFP